MLTHKSVTGWLKRSAAGMMVMAVAVLGIGRAGWAEFTVGAVLPEFSLNAVDGSSFSLQREQEQVRITHNGQTLKPKVLVLHLFQPDCLQCQAQMKALETLHQESVPQGVLVVGIAHRGNATARRATAQQLRVTFPLLVGAGSALAKQFAAGDTLGITDSRGIVRFAQVGYGAGDEKVWQENIALLLAGKPVTQPTIARKRLQVGDRFPVIELDALMTGKPLALTGEGGKLTFRDGMDKAVHPTVAIGFFSRY